MFLKRIFTKPPPVELAVEKLSIADVHERLKKLKTEKMENGRPKLNAVVAQMGKARETLLGELKALADAEPTEEIHPGLMKSATEARTRLVERMTRGLAEIGNDPEFSVAALANFDEKLTRATNLTTDAMVVHGRYVGSVFGSRFSNIQLYLRDLHEMFRQTHTIIKAIIDEGKSLDSVSSEVDAFEARVSGSKKIQDEIKSLETQARNTEETLVAERSQLAQLESGEEFKRATESMWEVNRIKLEINRVEGEVIGAFSEISRPLRKLENLASSGKHQMDRELMKTLELCIENPGGILFSDGKISAAETLLLQASKLISENKVDLGEKEKRKKLEKVKELATDLKEYKKRLELLNKQLEAQTQISEHPVQKQVAGLRHSVEQHESKLKHAKVSAEELDQKLRQAKEEIEKKRVNLEKSLGETLGAKVELTF